MSLCATVARRAHLINEFIRIRRQHKRFGDFVIAALDDNRPHGLSLESLILPGATIPAAQLHAARTICRRAERLVVALGDEETKNTIVYLNRLSDYLFIAARYANKTAGVDDVIWKGKRP